LYNFKDELVFTASDLVHGPEIWISDGTSEGTTLLKDIYEGELSSVASERDPFHNPEFVTLDDTLFFVANDGIHGMELWKSDGTTSGTQLAADINLSGHSDPRMLKASNGSLYFTANDGLNGTELWGYDHSPVLEIPPGMMR
jgi:ELWxxDGT repeat protein